MTNPRGAPPQALVLLDDTIFDAQCSADSQVLNTAQMLERFRAVFADGCIDASDTDDVLYLYRHTRLEDTLNREQCSLLKWSRVHCNTTVRLVEVLRGRIQAMKRAASAKTAHTNVASTS